MMTARHLCSALTAGLFACGVAALAPTSGRAQEANALPVEGGMVILVGCLQPEAPGDDEYVLMNTTIGPATTVAEASCTGTDTGMTVELKNRKHLDTSLVGRWVEVVGKLEKIEGDDLRELHVQNSRAVPVSPPIAILVVPEQQPVPEAEVQPVPQAEAPAPPEQQPIATTGVTPEPRKALPHTASHLPLTGSIGLLSIGAALLLRAFGRRRAEQRA